KFSVEIEFFNAPVLAVSDVEDAVLVRHDGVRQMELSRTPARAAPFADLFAIGSVLKDARVGVSIADEDPAFGRKRNISRSPEGAARRFRLPTHVDLKQLFARRTELEDRRTGCVDCPDVALGIEPER